MRAFVVALCSLVVYTASSAQTLSSTDSFSKDLDADVVKAIDANYIYCLSNDSIVSYAKEQHIGIIKPTLIINGCVIRDTASINAIRSSYHGNMIGNHHLSKITLISKARAEKMAFVIFLMTGLL